MAAKSKEDLRLPGDPKLEEMVLGAIMLGGIEQFDKAAALISETDFLLQKHKLVWITMAALREREDPIDRVTLASELHAHKRLELVDGLSWLTSLDEGLPEITHIESYARKVKLDAARRELMFAAQNLLAKAQNESIPIEDLVSGATDAIAAVQIGQGKGDDGKTPEDIVQAFPGGLTAFLDPSQRKRGIATGFRKLDEMLGGGLQDGELIILAARPSVGKSACMLNICQNISLHKLTPQRTDIFSLEMSGESLITRMLCAVSRVESHKFRTGFLGSSERRALQVGFDGILNAPLRIHDDFKKTLPGLVRRIRKAIKEGSKLIAIDYAQLMVTGGKTENRNLEIGEIGRTLKMITLELKTPILLLSQIGRSADKRGGDQRPQLSDLKDSGTLEEHADTVLAIYREELVKRDRDDNKGLADIDILKQRNGPTGRVPLRFVHGWTKFENRAEDTAFPEEETGETEPPPIAPSPQEDSW